MASFAEWHLIQFTADLRRHEPRNVGVVATDGQQWQLRLFGVDPDSRTVDGRSLRRIRNLTKDDYARWVEYYHSMIMDGRVDRVLQSQRKHPTEFRLVNGGQSELRNSLSEFVSDLYDEMVRDDVQSSENHSKLLQSKVERVLTAADISPNPDVVIRGRWGDRYDDIPFNYGYANGKLHLMDRVQLHQISEDQSKMIARDFNARAHAVMDAGTADSFVAFYSQSAVDELGGDSVLAPLWGVAKIVDVDDTRSAARDLRDILHVA